MIPFASQGKRTNSSNQRFKGLLYKHQLSRCDLLKSDVLYLISSLTMCDDFIILRQSNKLVSPLTFEVKTPAFKDAINCPPHLT